MTPGDPIVALDRAEREDELRSLDDQIRMRMNARERARLKLANALTELRGLELERSILRRTRKESAGRLARATATADLGSYRVEATLSDVHAVRISRGQAVRVRVGESFANGRLTNIEPAIVNGIMTVRVLHGDEVIVSDMSNYQDVRGVRVR